MSLIANRFLQAFFTHRLVATVGLLFWEHASQLCMCSTRTPNPDPALCDSAPSPTRPSTALILTSVAEAETEAVTAQVDLRLLLPQLDLACRSPYASISLASCFPISATERAATSPTHSRRLTVPANQKSRPDHWPLTDPILNSRRRVPRYLPYPPSCALLRSTPGIHRERPSALPCPSPPCAYIGARSSQFLPRLSSCPW